jgi:hypothetical protein
VERKVLFQTLAGKRVKYPNGSQKLSHLISPQRAVCLRFKPKIMLRVNEQNVLFEVRPFEKRDDHCSRANMNNVIKCSEYVIPQDNVFARRDIQVAGNAENIGHDRPTGRGVVLVDFADSLVLRRCTLNRHECQSVLEEEGRRE